MKPGDTITTRYFGGYERVDILSFDGDCFVVARFGGQTTDRLPMNQVEKVLREAPLRQPTRPRP